MTSEHHADKSARFERTLLPQVEAMVTVETTPHAVCRLSHADRPGYGFQLDADAGGVVRFHARPMENAKPVELVLDCTDQQGKVTRHAVALQAGTPTQPAAAPKLHGKQRPALTGDPMALSAQALIAQGYPPRPDPAKHPVRYARWLRQVSRPVTQVTPHQVPHPSVRFARTTTRPKPHAAEFSPTLPLPPPFAAAKFNANFSNWSGAYLTRPNGQFDQIQADWTVPGVASINPQIFYSAAAEWIGLDNSGTDLYQSGSDSECWFDPFFGWTFTNYWMWLELLPFAPWGIPNFPLSPGDAVSVDIFLADANGMTWFKDGSDGGLTGADTSVWFMVYNDTQRASFWGTYPRAPVSQDGLSSSGYTGTTAEFIVERPTDASNGSLYPLAFFGIADMNTCWYGDALYGNNSPFRLLGDGAAPFDGNLTYINMFNPSTGDTLAIPVSLPDPNSPGGSQILWLWTGSN